MWLGKGVEEARAETTEVTGQWPRCLSISLWGVCVCVCVSFGTICHLTYIIFILTVTTVVGNKSPIYGGGNKGPMDSVPP